MKADSKYWISTSPSRTQLKLQDADYGYATVAFGWGYITQSGYILAIYKLKYTEIVVAYFGTIPSRLQYQIKDGEFPWL